MKAKVDIFKLSIPKNKAGFLLFEIIVTVVIISSVLIVIQRAFMMSLKAIASAKDHTEAMLLLEEKLWDLENKGAIESDITEESNFPEPYDKFSFRLETKNIPEDDEEGLFNKVKLSVSWQERKRKGNIPILTYLPNKLEE